MYGRHTFLLYLLLPLAILRLLIRSLQQPAYRRRIPERFGFVRCSADASPIWVHAVSVGETQAAAPLVEALLERCPDNPLLVTTTTPAGSDRVRWLFGDRVMHCYFPYDLPSTIQRFLQRVRPAILVIMERELWPNVIKHCTDSAVPVVLANARLTTQAGRGYRFVRPLIRDALSRIRWIAAQTEEDARELIRLGAREASIRVTGNQKFDIQVPDTLAREERCLRERWGNERVVWAAASTHEGEEEILLTVYGKLHARFSSLLLVLVPRHPERSAKLADVFRRQGWAVCFLSDDACMSQVDIVIADTMGDLMKVYAIAEFAFIGGSLVPAGGHNPLEAAVLGRPTVFGPHMRNVAATSQLLLKAGASRQADNADELEQIAADWLEHPELREAAGQRAIKVVYTHRGATDKVVGMVKELLSASAIEN